MIPSFRRECNRSLRESQSSKIVILLMKNIKFISALALAMALVSCENYDLPNPAGQTNPEPDGFFEGSGLVLTSADANINLVEANQNNKDVTVANITELVNFPSDYSLRVDMEVAGDADYSNVTTISTTLVGDSLVTVNPDVLNGAIQKSITKKPGTYDVYARYVAYAVRENTVMRLGGLTATYCPSAYSIRTLDAAKVLEDSYYLVPCDAAGNPQLAKAMVMTNTLSGVSVYDNPEFAVKFDVTEEEATAGYKWKVLPASSVEAGILDGALGCNPSADSELTGKLGESYGPGVINLLGSVQVIVNVETDSYSANYAFEVLYPLSSSTLSKPQNALLLYTEDYINYSGVTVLNGAWFICGQPDFNGDVCFQQDGSVEPVDSEDGLTRSGSLASGEGSVNLKTPVSKNHLYWAEVNLVQLTYSISCLNTLSVIGSGNGWNLETATALTPSKDLKVWTAKDVVIGDEFKINANGAWTISFSGTQLEDATGKQVYKVNKQDGGDNLKATAGTYDVTVDFSAWPYTVTLE